MENNDKVNHPSHYNKYSIEIIRLTALLPGDLANCLKYIARHGNKAGESALDDLRKAQYYLKDFEPYLGVFTRPMPWLLPSMDRALRLSQEISPAVADSCVKFVTHESDASPQQPVNREEWRALLVFALTHLALGLAAGDVAVTGLRFDVLEKSIARAIQEEESEEAGK